jgi:hypothetical protein
LIQIGDINDNSPNCSTIRPLFLSEQQNLHRHLIGRLEAEDKDAEANGTVTYRLQKFNELFDLKPNGEHLGVDVWEFGVDCLEYLKFFID